MLNGWSSPVRIRGASQGRLAGAMSHLSGQIGPEGSDERGSAPLVEPISARPSHGTPDRCRLQALDTRSTPRPDHTRTPWPATRWASCGARDCRWRTWSSSGSTRPVCPASAYSLSEAARCEETSRRATDRGGDAERGARGLRSGRRLRDARPDPLKPAHIDAKLPDITRVRQTHH
jgi:hypothetical protein